MGAVFPTMVYSLCFATSALCAFLLGRSYLRSRSQVLFWSAACFALLGVVNGILVLDMLVYPDVDLRTLRLGLTLLAVSVLLYGFLWHEDA